jgi:mannose-1-phosphate guanylyltransferase/mannose-6-phosphate isomerase
VGLVPRLNRGDRYQLKCIMVRPGGKLSLQSHHHRSEHPGNIPAFLIEVQSGPYLNEDDIVRYDAIYRRSSTE